MYTVLPLCIIKQAVLKVEAVLCVGKQAVVVMACENVHMAEAMIMEPGLVMIFAHGVE